MTTKPLSFGDLSSSLISGLDRRVTQAQQLERNAQGKGGQTEAQHNQEIESAATQFEGLLLHEMFKQMWASVPKGGMLSGSHEEEVYQDMFQNALAEAVSKNQSIGVKDVIIRDIKATEARHKKAGPGTGNGAS